MSNGTINAFHHLESHQIMHKFTRRLTQKDASGTFGTKFTHQGVFFSSLLDPDT